MSPKSIFFLFCSFLSLPTFECMVCSISYLRDIPDGCTSWNGDLSIDYTYTFAFLTEKLSAVTRVVGRLSIYGTDFRNFSFFSSLEEIYYTPQTDHKNLRLGDAAQAQTFQFAFRVVNNYNLEQLGMDKLMTVTLDVLPTDPWFYSTSFYGNPKLCFNLEQTESWMQSERIKIPQFSYCNMNILEEDPFFKKFTVGNGTKVLCSMEWFNGSMPLRCQILDTGIWVKNNVNETDLEYFSIAVQSVEMMFGPIIVKNSSIKTLNFKNLRVIYNMHFEEPDTDAYGGWSKQSMKFTNNDLFTELLLPKIEQIHHYGDEAFVIVSGNSQLNCSREVCDTFLHLFRFDLNSCDCGIIPRFNSGYEVVSLLIVISESVLCAVITISTYGNIMYHVYRTGFSVSYFQFSMLVYLWLSCCETVFNVVNNVKFRDGLNYPWFIGLQFLLFSNNETYFYQTVNIIYTNRISLLLSCCLYRTISFISFDYGKIAMAISFMVFIVSNIWSFNGLLQNGSQFSYGIYLINWTTFAVSIITSIFLFFYLSKYFKAYPDMIRHQNRLSIAFFSQYSSTIIRWHYLAYALLLRVFLHDMISKVNIQSTSVAVVSSIKGEAGVSCDETKLVAMKRLLFVLLVFESVVTADGIDCVISFPLSQLPDNCTSMTGNLLVDGKNASLSLTNHLQYSVLLQKLSHVENWIGTIKILNTDFQNLSFFKNLKTVKASWNDVILENQNIASFWIELNPNLTTLGMSNLVDVYADVLPTNELAYSILIKMNKQLCMSEVEFLTLRTMERSYLFDFFMCAVTIQKYCFSEYFGPKNMPLGCQILMSGIWIKDETNTSLQTHLNEAFSTVEEVHGPIVIFRTDFTNLSFPVLHTIRNQFYNGENSWQWQLLIVRGNYFLKEFSVPKLRNLYHYGNQPQLTNSANFNWSYTSENCDTFQRFPFFSVTDTNSKCGLIPIINNGIVSKWLVAQYAEKVASLLFNFAICVYLTILMFKSNISVNFFHFAMVTLVCLTITENLYVNLDYIHIFNEKGFAIPYGVRSLFFTHDATLFNQISNVMYVNRLSLLLSCSVYRSIYLTTPYYEKYGLLTACATFVLSNVWNLSVMQNLENKYTYVLYQLNWITLPVTLVNAIYTKILIRSKSFKEQEELKRQHSQLSWSLLLQALWTFLFCGYSDGLNQYFTKNYQFIPTVRWWDNFFYWYGGVIIRWHYSMLIIIIIAFLPSTFVKFPQSAKVTTVGSVSKN